MSTTMNIKNYNLNTKINNAKIKFKSNEIGFFDFILKNEFLLIAIGFIAMIIASVVVAGLYQNVPEERQFVAFNQFNMILLALGFVFLILKFMNEKIDLFGKTFDMGMLLYIAVVMFVMFILG